MNTCKLEWRMYINNNLRNKWLLNFHWTIYQLKETFSWQNRCNVQTYYMHFLPVDTHPDTSSHLSAAQGQG